MINNAKEMQKIISTVKQLWKYYSVIVQFSVYSVSFNNCVELNASVQQLLY